MKTRIDLHTHSCCSDGTLTPSQLLSLAKDQGLTSIALTDHDTTAGLAQAQQAADSLGIEFVPGIEFSTAYGGTEIHIVGLAIDPSDYKLQETLLYFRSSRDRRNDKIAQRMQEDGLNVTCRQLREQFHTLVLTRAHFARFLTEQGRAVSIPDAFERYLKPGCVYHIPREKIPAEQAVSLIRSGGGIPVLAHPFLYSLTDSQLRDLVRCLKSAGLVGIEAYYPTHTPFQTSQVLALAREMNLAVSGGSDFHGQNKPDIQLGTGFGNLDIPVSVLERLREKAKEDV